MNPTIRESDLLLVEEIDEPNIQSDDMVIVEVEGEYSCKRVSKGEGTITFLPDNPRFRKTLDDLIGRQFFCFKWGRFI